MPSVLLLGAASSSEDVLHALCTVEWWVRVHLWPSACSSLSNRSDCSVNSSSDSSVNSNSDSSSSSSSSKSPYNVPHLLQLLAAYHTQAAACYAKDSLSCSRMVLTAFTLVAAMDKLACQQYLLLQQYSCGIASGSVLDALLLPHRHELEQLEAVQIYVQQRSNLQPSILESTYFTAAFAQADKVSAAIRYTVTSVLLILYTVTFGGNW
jgi:hypothetical protein